MRALALGLLSLAVLAAPGVGLAQAARPAVAAPKTTAPQPVTLPTPTKADCEMVLESYPLLPAGKPKTQQKPLYDLCAKARDNNWKGLAQPKAGPYDHSVAYDPTKKPPTDPVV